MSNELCKIKEEKRDQLSKREREKKYKAQDVFQEWAMKSIFKVIRE